MPINPFITNNFIDSCAFDPKYDPQHISSAEIFGLHEKLGLPLHIAHSTQKEIDHPNTPAWVKQEALKLIYTIEVQLTASERARLLDVQNILAGNGKIENILQDATHIFEAQKYGSYFITTDNRILSRADTLRRACDVRILLPSEFLSIVKKCQEEERDARIVPRRHEILPQGEGTTKEASKVRKFLYKGYIVDAVPYKLADSHQWTLDIDIWRDLGSEINIRHFSAKTTFETEEEAIYHCFNFGKQIIDGKYPGCSVEDLG